MAADVVESLNLLLKLLLLKLLLLMLPPYAEAVVYNTNDFIAVV